MLNKQVVLFDGECNFCSYWVKYVIKRDKKDQFRFASLQSKKGNQFLKRYKIKTNLDSVILIKNEQVFIKSDVALEIINSLGGVFNFLYVFKVIPRSIRDFFYGIIAKYRYDLFGKSACDISDHMDFKSKFL